MGRLLEYPREISFFIDFIWSGDTLLYEPLLSFLQRNTIRKKRNVLFEKKIMRRDTPWLELLASH